VKDIALPNPRLEVRDLRLMLAIEATGSTAAAAPVLHLTQPAVSRAVLALEDKLGTQLFERSPQGLLASERGQQLLVAARRLLADLAVVERQVCAKPLPAQRLRLVCQCYTAYHWLPTVAHDLRASFPGIELSLALEHTNDPVAALESGEIDVALLTTATVKRPDIEVRPLFADEIVLVLSPEHALAQKRSLTADDLQTTTLLVSTVTPPAESQRFLQHALGRRKLRLTIQRLPLTEAILDAARAGMGVAVLSEWIAGPHLARGDLVARRLTRGPLHRPWRLASRKEVASLVVPLKSALEATVPHTRF
jgi:LysR family transcriptional regulator, regulator for metE and metH